MARNKLTFGFVWDRHNPNFHENAEYQNLFFRAQENYINDRLKAGKFITVNDVADMLGFERSPKGMIYGWDSDENIQFIIRRDRFIGTVTLELFASNIYEEMSSQVNSSERRELNKDLEGAIELLDAALKLRMYGDISHMPMSQAEWDSRTEEFLRNLNEE